MKKAFQHLLKTPRKSVPKLNVGRLSCLSQRLTYLFPLPH